MRQTKISLTDVDGVKRGVFANIRDGHGGKSKLEHEVMLTDDQWTRIMNLMKQINSEANLHHTDFKLTKV